MSEPDFFKWKDNPTPQNLGKLIYRYTPILRAELPKYYGNLPPETIASYGKKIIIDALKTYDPNKGAITTHLVSNLQRLHRVNYETSSALRMSEELQRGVNVYKEKKDYLTDKLNREPSLDELADELGWTESRVARTAKMLKTETLESGLSIAPKSYDMEDPRLDYIYHDLDPHDKIIFQHKIGYKGSPVMMNNDIAKKVKMSPANVSIRSSKIADLLKERLGII